MDDSYLAIAARIIIITNGEEELVTRFRIIVGKIGRVRRDILPLATASDIIPHLHLDVMRRVTIIPSFNIQVVVRRRNIIVCSELEINREPPTS